jgi:hypothetical protein
MAEPKKNKIGLHKHVSSVLEGVRIPQGIHNWRPPDESGPDWTGDSPKTPKSAISSVFEGLSVLAADDFLMPTRKHAQDYSANIASIQTPEGGQTSPSGMAQNPDGPEESSVDALWAEQSESSKRVAYYHDPLEETPTRSLREWVREKLFGANA